MYYKIFSCCVRTYAYKIKLIEEVENEISSRLDVKILIENQIKTEIFEELLESKFQLKDHHKNVILNLKRNNTKFIRSNLNNLNNQDNKN